MLEEPCIIQMNIDRFTAMLNLRLADDQRARIEQSLAEAHTQLGQAIQRLARAIEQDEQAEVCTQARPLPGRSHPRQSVSMIMRRWALVAFVAGATCGVVRSASAQDAAAGEAVFKSQCGICHSLQAGKNLVGPSLFGIVGRPAGKAPGFHYSPANRDSGLTWDAATLDRYLTSPGTVVPHTIMTYGGLKDAKKRADLIAYLSTLH
jgi:cytochrome c